MPASAFRDYRCGPSEQFDGFVWCQRNRPGGARRGPFSVTQSLLHSRDGKIAYVNRQQNPVVFDSNDVEDDIRSFSRRFGSQPRITKLPRRGGLEGVMALWGDVAIEPLDDDSVKMLADGQAARARASWSISSATSPVGAGRTADLPHHRRRRIHLGREFRSARPRYASPTAVDASVLASPPVADAPPPKPVADSPSPESAAAPAQVATAAEPPSGTGRVRTEIVDPKAQQTGTPEKAAPHVAATEPPAPANAPQPIVESAKAEATAAEPANTMKPEPARLEVQTAEAQNTGAVGEAGATDEELARLRTATRLAFAIVAALLIALVATLLMMFGRRKRASNAMLAAKRGSMAASMPAPSVSAADAAGPRLPTYAPTLEGGPSTVVHTVFDSPVAARAVNARRDDEATTAPAPDLTEADPAPLSPAAMEEQSGLSIVPSDPPDRAEITAQDDPVQRLVELAKLRANGMLTESEFNQLKASIIAATARDSAAPSDGPPHTAL